MTKCFLKIQFPENVAAVTSLERPVFGDLHLLQFPVISYLWKTVSFLSNNVPLVSSFFSKAQIMDLLGCHPLPATRHGSGLTGDTLVPTRRNNRRQTPHATIRNGNSTVPPGIHNYISLQDLQYGAPSSVLIGLGCHPISHKAKKRRSGEVVRLLASPLGEPCSIPGGVIPGFSHVGIAPDDAADWRVFWEFPVSLDPFVPALLHRHLVSPSPALKTSILVHEKADISPAVAPAARSQLQLTGALATHHCSHYRLKMSGNLLDSHSGEPGFYSRSSHFDFCFPWFPEITPGECCDGSLKSPWPIYFHSLPHNLAPSLMTSLSTGRCPKELARIEPSTRDMALTVNVHDNVIKPLRPAVTPTALDTLPAKIKMILLNQNYLQDTAHIASTFSEFSSIAKNCLYSLPYRKMYSSETS
ncbi:hypothetical protein PR048_006787 [Dryococelus australis]|uniref:Uncharacterized protein n=1 Tax=Dryococelus australis TaxID=614101 RepID=A0ABQ9IBW7_9NEOP|nr:hypothetical protein PR048_006787 [Dryococelus australis]